MVVVVVVVDVVRGRRGGRLGKVGRQDVRQREAEHGQAGADYGQVDLYHCPD